MLVPDEETPSPEKLARVTSPVEATAQQPVPRPRQTNVQVSLFLLYRVQLFKIEDIVS